MKLLKVAAFAHLLGISEKRYAKKTSALAVQQTPVLNNQTLRTPRNISRNPALNKYSHLAAQASVHCANSPTRFHAHGELSKTEALQPPMTSTEAAQFIVAVGNKVRGNENPRRFRERIGDMMSRQKIDMTTGIAAQIINAGRKARGETI